MINDNRVTRKLGIKLPGNDLSKFISPSQEIDQISKRGIPIKNWLPDLAYPC